MKNIMIMIVLLIFGTVSCNHKSGKELSDKKIVKECDDDCCIKKGSTTSNNALTCKLTSPELQQRKATVLESLRKQIPNKKELKNGYAFKFNGSDKMIDELTEFAKTERQRCDFFTFNIAITGDTSSVWFEITGVPEAKEFIKTELEL